MGVPSAAAGPAPQVGGEFRQGSIQRGQVTAVSTQEVQFIFPGGLTGSVPFLEFAGHPMPREGDEVSLIVEQYDPLSGHLVLSKRHADEVLFWHTVQPGDLLEGVVTGMNKGGLDIDIGGARAFLPASHVDVHRVKDISTLIGEHVTCVVTQVDRTTKDLIVSRRKFLERQRKESRQKAFAGLLEGETRKGVVTNLVDYGAFVDLGGVDGLIHITDLSWGRIHHPSEVLTSGQEVEVRVLHLDREKGKVSLGLKQLRPDPWSTAGERYPAGAKIRAKVARLADFGAFLALEEGIDALLPLSEMTWSRRVGRVGDYVKVGDETEVVVLKVEPDRQRISVGLRQTTEDPWQAMAQRFPANEKFKGKVLRTADFGAFVELAPGVEGMVHISELSDRRVKAVQDVVKPGDEVEVRVLRIDAEQQRISLSMKPPPAERPVLETTDRAGKSKHKRPLRGGLSSHFDW